MNEAHSFVATGIQRNGARQGTSLVTHDLHVLCWHNVKKVRVKLSL
jgi:hypothetical protein